MRRWVVGTVVIALIAVGVIQGSAIVRERARRESRQEAVALVDRWLRLWASSDWSAMRVLVEAPPRDFATTYENAYATLGVEQARFRHGAVRYEGDDPGVTFSAELELDGFGPYRYDGRLPIRRRDGTWRVRWTPAVLHPLLTESRRFDRVRQFAPRAPLVDANGDPLSTRDSDVSAIVGSVGPATPEQAATLARPTRRATWSVSRGCSSRSSANWPAHLPVTCVSSKPAERR